MNNSLNIYYKPITDFLNNLNYKFANDTSINFEKLNRWEEKLNYETLDFNFICRNNDKISFCISLSYNDFDSPRLTMLLRKPESEEFYEIFDKYLNEKDNNIESAIKYLESVLGNEFKIVYSFLNGKKIKENYIFSIITNNRKIIINDLGYKKGVVFPWNKKNVLEKTFLFKPWIIPPKSTISASDVKKFDKLK